MTITISEGDNSISRNSPIKNDYSGIKTSDINNDKPDTQEFSSSRLKNRVSPMQKHLIKNFAD